MAPHVVVVVTLLCLFLTFPAALSQVIRRGKCPNILPAQNFDIYKMTGVWYLQYVYFSCAQQGIKCSVYNMTVVDYEGKPALAFHDRSYDENTGRLRTRDTLKILNPTNPAITENREVSNCVNYTTTCTYVSTGFDYDYFIYYCCKPFKTSYKYEFLGIRTRVKQLTTLLWERILLDLISKGIDQNFMYPIAQDCEDDPPDQ